MIKIFNSLTRKKKEFKPIKAGEVGMYTCGPTVYNFAHIGNLRAYVFADILKRALKRLQKYKCANYQCGQNYKRSGRRYKSELPAYLAA